MQVSDIVTRVRAAIDELMANDSGFLSASVDEKNLDEIIKDKISYALQHIIEVAPLDKLGTEMFSTLADSSRFYLDGLIGKLRLPSDLLRIVEARLSSWSQYPLPESDTSQEFLMQQDEYARGSWDRPVNILTYEGTERVLLMYSAKSSGDSLKFTYIAKPNISSSATEVNVPTRLEAALVYQVAGLTMVAFREDIAQSLFAIADRYIGLENNETAA